MGGSFQLTFAQFLVATVGDCASTCFADASHHEPLLSLLEAHLHADQLLCQETPLKGEQTLAET